MQERQKALLSPFNHAPQSFASQFSYNLSIFFFQLKIIKAAPEHEVAVSVGSLFSGNTLWREQMYRSDVTLTFFPHSILCD